MCTHLHDFDVGAVESADDQTAVHGKLHVAVKMEKIQLSSCVLLDARKGDDMCFCGAICAAMHVCVCACVRTCVMRACVRDV